ncbi:MAG TPA: hypothetical protein DCL95_03185 [Rhodospirillaceae bacterium]|nr:hypothetical protein [Rhodospirillaceae bacterium]MAX64199.1 hypothetical protein [Rhodospirillaceae bacterium]MBB56161.1 hypothetical protein [Rhodospirillaceae bacterium]HAJ19056.1 hypothetical protein [Rhodospirillaceae bacterium]|tara:strand:- start:28468 stop:29427 length:960 start_codon:yes stop_codon:yes gene_type:complete
MEFRANQSAARLNSQAADYFTENLSDRVIGLELFNQVRERLGNAVESLPDWHPILTAPPERPQHHWHASNYSSLPIYDLCVNTREFVRGILTCPNSEVDADKLVEVVNQVQGLNAERLESALYRDSAFPVLIEAWEVELEADGTIRSRDALAWFVQATVKHAREAQVAETWWNVRQLTLGSPHGARSSLLVNDYTGRYMRKILETLNDSGIFGPIKEMSLDMLPERKRSTIGQTLMRAALEAAAPLVNVTDEAREFKFELRGETCKVRIRDTWGDGMEYSVRVSIGDFDLTVSGFYYPKNDKLEHTDPTGKQKLAEKFT